MSVDTSDGHSEMDYAEVKKTYSGFIKLSIYTTILCLIVLAGMAAFLT